MPRRGFEPLSRERPDPKSGLLQEFPAGCVPPEAHVAQTVSKLQQPAQP